jgi:hypothetical protein
MRVNHVIHAIGVVGLTTLSGCASVRPSAAQYSVRRVAATREALLDSAEIVLGEMGYSVARRDAAGGVLVTHPVEGRSAALRAGGDGRTARRVVEVRVEAGPDGQRVFCKAAVQEQASHEYQMLRAAGGDEGIGETAIERDAATTAEQNVLWRTVSRDRALERKILDAIQRRAVPDAAPAE